MKMSTLTFAALLLLTSAPLVLAQGTYTQIDYPGAQQTVVYGIDTAGEIVGYYLDANSWYGFLLSGRIYTTITYPGAAGTFPAAINDQGQIVGYTEFDGFLYDVQTQAFTMITYPGAQFTTAFAINNDGAVAGFFSFPGTLPQGYELVGSNYTKIVPPVTGLLQTELYGIAGSGEVVGVAYKTTSTHTNFLFSRGKYRKVTIPKAPSGFVTGINGAGSTVVGWYGNDGFLYQDGALQLLSFPGASLTVATGINRAGEVVGHFEDSTGVSHGFTWTPPAPVEKK